MAECVYIVDGNEAAMSLVEDALASAGYATLHFPDADALIEAASDAAPACILLGIGLVGDDRLGGLHRIRRELDHWPVIAMSTACDPTLAAQALHAGAQDFIVAPLDRDELVDMVRAVSSLVD